MQLDASKAPGRRARFYSSTIDYDHLSKGEWYTKLPHVYVIFFTTADPLNEGLALQKFTVRSEESNKEFDFGLTYMYYNINFESANVPARMEEFLNYLRNPRDIAAASDDPLVQYAEKNVQDAKTDPTVRRDIMLLSVKLWDAKEDGRKEGLEEGRKEGLEEGRKGLNNELSRAIPLIYEGKSKAEIMQLTGVSVDRTPALSVLWGCIHEESQVTPPFEEELITAEEEAVRQDNSSSNSCKGMQHMNL